MSTPYTYELCVLLYDFDLFVFVLDAMNSSLSSLFLACGTSAVASQGMSRERFGKKFALVKTVIYFIMLSVPTNFLTVLFC
jgi:hypothetical protein